MGRRTTDTNVTVTLDRDERADLMRYGMGRRLTVAAMFRIAMNEYLERHEANVPALEIRAKQGRPRKIQT